MGSDDVSFGQAAPGADAARDEQIKLELERAADPDGFSLAEREQHNVDVQRKKDVEAKVKAANDLRAKRIAEDRQRQDDRIDRVKDRKNPFSRFLSQPRTLQERNTLLSPPSNNSNSPFGGGSGF